MRFAIASRIFEPEASAASFRLAALADALHEAGHEVEVLTVRPPRGIPSRDDNRPYRIKRFPVLRDRTGYVRGYLQYLSFDVPLFLRVLLGSRRDLIVVEPPPTTGFFVRLAALLRRIPYVYYAADIWSEAAAQTSAPGWVLRAVRGVEGFALRGARGVLAVSAEVADRLVGFGVDRSVRVIGNGVDVESFRHGLGSMVPTSETSPAEVFVYAGTASEWHGAEVFVEALPEVLRAVPKARLRFIGGGSAHDALLQRARSLNVSHAITFEPTLPPEALAPILRDSAAALASVRPDSSYSFAFPTKLYSAAVCGAPLIYSGEGSPGEFVSTLVDGEPLGISAGCTAAGVAEAMIRQAAQAISLERRGRVSDWASREVSLDAVARRAVRQLEEAAR